MSLASSGTGSAGSGRAPAGRGSSAGLGTTGNVTALVGLIIAVSMTTIDQTIVALSAPTIEADLHFSHDAMQWAVNAYLIATAAVFLLGGRLADVVGHKRMALIGIAAFGATSLLCGLAPEGDLAAPWLITARVLQGAAGALMFPAAIGLVVQGFSRESRGRAMAIFFAITGAMTAVGPIAGGYLSVWTWRAIFWVNVPLAIAAFVIVAIAAERRKASGSTPKRERIDLVGALIAAAGLAGIVFGLQQAAPWGWTNPAVLGSIGGGILLLVLFGFVESRTAQPLVKLQVFRDRGFTLATLATLFASIAFLSTFFFLSVYGQVSLELSALSTGLLFLKFFIGFVVASRLGSVRFDRSGAKGVLVLGGLAGAAGFAWLAYSVTSIPSGPGAFFNAQTWPILLAGLGIGYMFSAASTDAVNRAIGASYGEVTAISQTMRNFGGALGIAVLGTVVTGVLSDKLTASFVKLGASAQDAADAVSRIGGAAAASTSQHLSALPAAVREQFIQAVHQGYAESVAWAFVGMAVAMLAVAVLGVLYPKGQVSAKFDEPDAAEKGTSAEGSAADTGTGTDAARV
ncbi:MFS transporter [Humibacter ginsenosidimutans]|uniref:MFS transporter n=1 Tax=Humibacter ginsenosidimutans TaxID=2599293 RepID=A0A5B8M9C5_9MICO|nr:MFS transporter [Humibacter ginsenosidimutans]QDZ16020.1 MFS transporter [Humibacter ginsenosidimutans]